MRVLPRNNDDVNEEWISDKTRYACDGLQHAAARPSVRARRRQAAPGELGRGAGARRREAARRHARSASAPSPAISPAPRRCSRSRTCSAASASKNLDCRQDGAKLDPALGRASYLFNSTIAGIEQADAILLVGTNPRLEAAVLNARILKRWRQGGLKVGVIGEPAQLTYAYEYMGAGAQTLGELADGKHSFAETLQERASGRWSSSAPALPRAPTARRCSALAARIALGAARRQGRCRLEPLQRAAHGGFARRRARPRLRAGRRAASTSPAMLAAAGKGKLDVLYLLGADEIELPAARQSFVIYQGQPRRPRRPSRRRHPPGRRLHGKERHLRQHRGPRADDRARRVPAGRGQGGLGDPARAVGQGRANAALRQPRRAARGHVQGGAAACAPQPASKPAPRDGVEALAKVTGSVGAEAFASPIRDFYLTNPIARASAVMAEMSALKKTVQASPRLKAAE